MHADTNVDGHYLNLPVMGGAGDIVGMVDVLKLTYATLDQINSMSTGDGEGPAWNKFWLSLDNDTESVASGEGSRVPRTPDTRSFVSPEMARGTEVERPDIVMPHESASHRDEESPERPSIQQEDTPFAFKFKAPSGRMHRLQVVASAGMEELVANVAAKLGVEVDAVGGEPPVDNGRLGKSGFALSYLDNEGDTVSITTNDDLMEAIGLARANRRDKVDLFVHHPERAPLPATLDPHPGLAAPPTPAESAVGYAKQSVETTTAAAQEVTAKPKSTMSSKKAEQVVGGMPNEYLIPGAIAALAVVLVGVFAIGRSSK